MDEHEKKLLNEQFKESPFVKSIQVARTTFEWLNDINRLQKTIASMQQSSKVFDSIIKELEQRNINTEVIGRLKLSEILKLYNLSNETGLTFADMAEDNLQTVGELKYEQAVSYLECINRRKGQIVKNDIKNFKVEEKFIEHLEYIEDSSGSQIKSKIEAYERGEIDLTEREKKILAAFKKNQFLTNKHLADMFGYSVRNIEEICRKIREKFEIDFVEDKLIKRTLLTNLAKYITL